MSFLTLLCFSCILYAVIADPVPSTPNTDASIKQEVEQLVASIEASISKHLDVVFKNLNVDDKAYLESTCMQGIAGVLNYVFFVFQEVTNPKNLTMVEDTDVIIQMISEPHFFPGFTSDPTPAPNN